MKKPEAHHNLPWKYGKRFAEKGLDVNEPCYGRWVEGSPEGTHQNWSKEYEREWIEFFDTVDEPSADDMLGLMHRLEGDPRFE